MGRTGIRHSILLSLALWLLPAAAEATTFVLMDHEQLLAASDAVVVGTVTAIESAAPDPGGPIYTYVHVDPDLVIKGDIGLDPIVLQEPGGSVGGRTEWIFGAPEFWAGERSVLFLSRNADGSLQTTNLSMGKYTVGIDATGASTAVRHFGYGASVFVPATGRLLEAHPETEPLTPLLGRLRSLARLEAARRPQRGQPLIASAPKLPPGTFTEHVEAFTLLGSPPARWFEPDSGQSVRFLVDSTGDATLGAAASRAAADAAMAAWTNVPTANLVLEDAGTAAPVPWRGCDVSEISFNDPGNEISQPHDCGGILAIGGFCSGSETTVVHGRTFVRITSGKAIINNGWGTCSFWNECTLAEIIAHELGHAIGFGHSSDKNATMSPDPPLDGRCAALGRDDAAAVAFVYPASGGPPPAPTPTSPSSPETTPTATPPSTGGPTTVPATPTPIGTARPPAASCEGAKKLQVRWSAKDPWNAQVFVSATHCPPPPHCDTPFAGGLATAPPAALVISDATNGTFAMAIDQPGRHHGGCPSGSDSYQVGASRLRLIFGGDGQTTVLARVSVPQLNPGPPTVGTPLTFTLRDASGFAVNVSGTTCFTRQSATRTDIKCF